MLSCGQQHNTSKPTTYLVAGPKKFEFLIKKNQIHFNLNGRRNSHYHFSVTIRPTFRILYKYTVLFRDFVLLFSLFLHGACQSTHSSCVWWLCVFGKHFFEFAPAEILSATSHAKNMHGNMTKSLLPFQ